MEISESIRQELGLFLVSLVTGNLLVVLYDLLRIIRRVIPHRNAVVAVEDVLYWLLCGFVVFILLFHNSDGVVRGFVIGGISLGMLAWNHYISTYTVEPVSRLLRWIGGKIARPLRFCGKILLRPLRIVSKYIKSSVHHIGSRIKKQIRAWKIAFRKM